MCGITGFIDLSRGTPADRLAQTGRAMADSIRHRGPDSDGVWTDAETGVALAHRRLAIIDLSAEGAQPMASADGRYVISYNGEVYNFPELRVELESRGHAFRGRSDTEIMLAAIVEWGLTAAVERFVGMFAFALWDRQDRRLHLVRDRLGIKPLYYGRIGRTFLFGSELRSLQAHPGFQGDIDRDALTLYMRLNCIPAPHSIFRQIRKLAPASVLTLDTDSGEVATETYWSLKGVAETAQRTPFAGNIGEATDELERCLGEAVRCRMVADVPLGVFLSGGVDSSTVAALMQASSDRPVKTFSIGFRDGAYNEAEDAAAVARHLGTEHHELYVTPREAQAVVPRLGAMYDEPFADSSQLPTYLVSEMARRHVTVALSGDGGDETFGGYNRYLWSDRVACTNARLPRGLRRLLAGAITSVSPPAWDRFGGLLRQRNAGDKLHKLAGLLDADGLPEIYRRLISQWQDPAEIVVGGREPEILAQRSDDWLGDADFAAQMMYLDARSYLPDDILTKVDRASMAVSLEARVPILDHRVVAFAWSLPLSLRIHDGIGKRLLRELLYRHVPRALIERPKMGFAVPIHDWLRGPLRDWAEVLLDENRLRREGFFDPAPIRTRWTEHLSGRRNWQHQLWEVLMFQAWQEARAA